MADQAPVVHIGENSPEQIAYRLFLLIGAVEGRMYQAGNPTKENPPDRQWILNAFKDCMNAVRYP